MSKDAPIPEVAIRVLCVEDSLEDVALIKRVLATNGFNPTVLRVDSEGAFVTALGNHWDVIVSDHSIPGFDTLRALRAARERGVDYPFIVVSGTINEEDAVEAMRAGAQDYVMKGDLRRLVPAIRRELVESENRRLRRQAEAALEATEAQLRQAQKMEAVGRLSASVAHDFNNVLTVIMGFAQLALDDLEDGDPAAQRESLEQILQAGETAVQMTRQLLGFSRNQVLKPANTRLDELVRNMMPMLRRLVSENIILTADAIANLEPVLIDPGQFEQVVMNLVVNARDAMPDGGRLTFRLSRATIDAYEAATLDVPPGSFVSCEVADTGHGMDEETRLKMFEPFFTTKDPGRGTGLGLATVDGIVRQYGGRIRVVTAPGQGTTFHLLFPIATGPAADAALPPDGATTSGGHGRILVVEDDPRVRQFVTTVLRHGGFEVLEARAGGQALGLAKQAPGPIDLLLADVVLPGESGPTTAAALQRAYPTLPVLFMTGYAEHAALDLGLSLPNSAHLQKPFLPNELLATVARMMESRESKARPE